MASSMHVRLMLHSDHGQQAASGLSSHHASITKLEPSPAQPRASPFVATSLVHQVAHFLCVGAPTLRPTDPCLQHTLTVRLTEVQALSSFVLPPRQPPAAHEVHLRRSPGHAVGLDRVYMERGIDTGQDLLARLQRVPSLLAPVGRPPLRCIVIDSIGHIFRCPMQPLKPGPMAMLMPALRLHGAHGTWLSCAPS